MKFTNLGLIFSMIFLSFTVFMDTKTREIVQISHLQIQYNQALDNAMEAAMNRLIEVDSGKRKRLNKEEAVSVFFDSLSIHFNINNNKTLKNKLMKYVPVVGVILEEGFYICYDEIKGKRFSEFYPYKYDVGNITYYFTMTDYIRIVDNKNGDRYSGDFHDLSNLFQDSFLMNEEEFNRIKKDCIIDTITEKLSYYMTEHNKIAKQYGIKYQFFLPKIPKEDWYKTIENISMIGFFQGYPYGNRKTGTYNRFVVSGARVHKK